VSLSVGSRSRAEASAGLRPRLIVWGAMMAIKMTEVTDDALRFETRRKAQAWLNRHGYVPCRPNEITRRVSAYWKSGSFARLEREGNDTFGETIVRIEEVVR
jgi:hypothetical protein